jgi:predicted secreted protein
MKKYIASLFIIAAGMVAAQSYNSPVKRSEKVTVGTTNTYYFGTADAAVNYTPSTNDITWNVKRIITVDGDLQSIATAYRTEGQGDMRLTKWADRATTNVTYKVE